jgi:hypothetical protein
VLINDAPTTHLQWVPGSYLAPEDLAKPHFLLGLRNDVAHFALDASEGTYAPELESCRFEDARTAATMLSAEEAAIPRNPDEEDSSVRVLAVVRSTSQGLTLW